jgi:hypothetical protein
MECDGLTPQDSKRNLPPALPAVAVSMEQVCVCVQESYFSVSICPTNIVQHGHSGNSLTAHRVVVLPCHSPLC